jgi:hypothetical protein
MPSETFADAIPDPLRLTCPEAVVLVVLVTENAATESDTGFMTRSSSLLELMY